MATKKIKNSKRLKKLAPNELEDIWDEEISEHWLKLNPKQQKFLVQWLSNGYNASQAYKDVYNENAEDLVAAASGSRALSSVNIQAICGKMSNNNKTELISIKKVFTDALTAETPIFGDGNHIMDIDDHKTRILAANSLAKLNGELIEKSEKVVKVTNNIQINQAQMGDLNGFLAKVGATPLKPIVAVAPKQTVYKQAVVEEDVGEVVFGSFGDDSMGVVD